MIILSKPAPMKKALLAYPPEYSDQVTSFLQDVGVIDLEPYEPAKILSEYESLKKLHDQILGLMSKSDVVTVRVNLLGAEASMLSIEKIHKDVSDLLLEVEMLESQIGELSKRLDDLQMLNTVIDRLPETLDPQVLFYIGRRISSIISVCKKEYVERVIKQSYIKAFSVYVLNEEQSIVIAVLDKSKFNEYLELLRSMNAWYPKTMPHVLRECENLACVKGRVRTEIENTKRELEKLKARLVELIVSNLERLGKYLLYVQNELERYKAISRLLSFRHLVGVQGWIPADKADKMISGIRNTGLPVYVEIRDPEPSDNPPTLMKNAPVLRFYQVVTRLYGVPGYREWDPTPLIAYSFALFFGLMNADVGYALLGILAVFLVLDRMVENPESSQYKEFKGVLAVSNLIALFLGALSGAFFGDLLRVAGITLPVLVPDLVDPLGFIKFSIIIGLIHVNIAHLLATVKFYRERKRGDLLIELGLVVGQVFGIPYILDVFLRYRVPYLGDLPTWVLQTGALAGVMMIIIGSVVNMRALGLLMWLFQITGLLGDVLSYVRLAGVGMATYYMSMGFNYMAEMVIDYFNSAQLLGLILALPILVLAHLMVFVLAQLGAFVHSLRLCMLEFLTKFYEGYGREYNPLSIVKSAVIVLKK